MGRLGVTLDILNQKGTPAFYSDTFANRPAAGFRGRVFISTDTGAIYEDTGSTWTLIADAGAGTTGTLQQVTTNGNTTTQGISITAGGLSSNQVSIVGGTASQFLKADGTLDSSTYLTTGSAASTYLPLAGGTLTGNLAIPSNQLAIGTATAGAPLDVHTATGTAAQFNGTGTNNAYIFFQNAGTSKWRIGNYYNGATNQFTIYNNAASVTQLVMDSGATTLIGNFTATTLIKSGGTSAQFLKADGSVDSNTYLTTDSAASTYLPLAGGTLTNSLTSTNSAGTYFNATNTAGGYAKFEISSNATSQSTLSFSNSLSITGGDVTFSNKIIKSGGTSAQILAADGSVITAGTNITISGGTISASGGGMAIGGSITSATAGSVLYAGASGVLAQSNSNFYYDYTNVRLGLGTNTIGSTLQINGSAAIGYNTSTIAPSSGLAVSGNVGIGTTSLLYAAGRNGATIRAASAAGVEFILQPSTVTNGTEVGLAFIAVGTATVISNRMNGELQFHTNNTERARLDSSGNFGINTTTIGSKLQVFGNAAIGYSASTTAPTNGLVVSGTTLIGTTTDSGQGVLQVSGGVTAGGISLTGEVLSASATLNKGYYHVFTGAAGQTLTLPSPSSNNYQYVIINNTANSVTIAAAASTTITTTTGTSVASITLIANARTFILADGSTKYYQVY